MTTDKIGPNEPLPPQHGFGVSLTFYIPTPIGQRLEARCRTEGVLDLQGRPDLGLYAEMAVLEAGGGAFTVGGAKQVIDGDDADVATLVREIVRSQLLAFGHFEAAGRL